MICSRQELLEDLPSCRSRRELALSGDAAVLVCFLECKETTVKTEWLRFPFWQRSKSEVKQNVYFFKKQKAAQKQEAAEHRIVNILSDSSVESLFTSPRSSYLCQARRPPWCHRLKLKVFDLVDVSIWWILWKILNLEWLLVVISYIPSRTVLWICLLVLSNLSPPSYVPPSPPCSVSSVSWSSRCLSLA